MINYFGLSKERYLLLAKKGENLSQAEKEELVNYKYFLISQVTYNYRFQYLSILDDYITGKIDAWQFNSRFNSICWKVYETNDRIESDLKELANLPMDFHLFSKMKKFTYLIYDMWHPFDHPFESELQKSLADHTYNPDFSGIINLVHNAYPEMQKYLK